MNISFKTTRNLGIGVLLTIICAISFFSFNNINKIAYSLRSVITTEMPVREKADMITRILIETKYSFELYIRRDRIDLKEIISGLERLVEESLILEEMIGKEELLTERIKAIKALVLMLIEHEKISPFSDTTLLIRDSALQRLSSLYKALFATNRQIRELPDNLKPSAIEKHQIITRMLSDVRNYFNQYLKRNITVDDVLTPLDRVVEECVILETMVGKEEDIVIKELITNIKRFRVSILSYVEQEGIQEGGGDTAQRVKESALKTQNDVHKSLIEVQQKVDNRIRSNQSRMFDIVANIRSVMMVGIIAGIVIAILGAFLMNRALMKPITSLVVATKRLASGELTYRAKITSEDEIGHLAKALNRMAEDLQNITVSRDTLSDEIKDRIRIQEELEQAKLAAESANRAKSEFLANMSHEIRTPMNSVLGFAEILLGKITDEQHRTYLRTILSSGETLLALINDILDLSKIEAGKLELEYEPVNIRRILTEIRQMFQQRVHQKDIEFKTEISDDLPVRLITDEIRLRQILINLTGNAIKFTSEGYVKISAKCEMQQNEEEGQIIIRPYCDLMLDVEDTGIGIPKDQQIAIFESFQQQNGQSTRQYGGTGLGLTITRRLIELMNGHISVHSEAGQGSIFRIKFDNLQIAAQTESLAEESQILSINDKFEPAEIMIVDDIRNNRDLVKGYLENIGLSFTEADSGEKALCMLENQIPDLILMDLRMPGKDGYEITEIIRNNQELMSVPVIALTASAMKNVEEKIHNLFDGYLRKPVSKKLLIEELKKFLPWKTEIRGEENMKSDHCEKIASEQSGEHRAEIVQALNKLIPEWKEISDTFFIDDVVVFAQKIKDIAQKYDFKMLTDFGQALYDAAQNNNFSQMEKLTGEFTDMIDKIGSIN